MSRFYLQVSERKIIFIIIAIAIFLGILILFNVLPTHEAAIPYFLGILISLLLTIYYGKESSWIREVILEGNSKILSEIATNNDHPLPKHGREKNIEVLIEMVKKANKSMFIWRSNFSSIDEIEQHLDRRVKDSEFTIKILMNINHHSYQNAEKIVTLMKKYRGKIFLHHIDSKIRGELYDEKIVRLINKVDKEEPIESEGGRKEPDYNFWYNHYMIQDPKSVLKIKHIWNYCWKHSDEDVEDIIRRIHMEIE